MGNGLFRVIWLLFLSLVFTLLFASCGKVHEDERKGNPPLSPDLMEVKAVSDSEIVLKWYAYSYTFGVIIERYSEADGKYLLIATVTDGSTGYHDTNLESAIAYTYRLLAYNQNGYSDYSWTDSDMTYYHGYSLCPAKNSWYKCVAANCGATYEQGLADYATGTEVFNCLGESLHTLSTMTVTFYYKSWADSCYNQPILTVRVGTQSVSFNYSCQTSPMAESTVSIAVPIGTTLNDISFDLTSGDWGAQVVITSITFTP